MASNNPKNEHNWDLLVRVSGNFLEFNENVWLRLTEKYTSNRLIVLSVVGQPKSRKTTLLNEIISLLPEDEVHSSKRRFPLISEVEWSIEEGILVYKCQTPYTTFILLDIWSRNSRIETYNKLVDLCLVVSSTVIFSESWIEEPSVSCTVMHFFRSD